MDGYDLNLTGIERRLNVLNPGYTRLRVEPSTKDGMAIKVVIETTRDELSRTKGRLALRDPELPPDARIETVLRFLDRKPGETIKVELRRRNPENSAG